MESKLQPVCAGTTRCKCCGAAAILYGVVDFNKDCGVGTVKNPTLSGVPVYYHRCPACRFLFTTAFDHFTKADFLQHIYNNDYVKFDPEYEHVRARRNASILSLLFPGEKPRRLLDYGGGNSKLAGHLLASGFPHVDSYDPFVESHSQKPTGKYDCVVSFEVAEHSTDPAGTFGEMNELMDEPGLILFSTLLQPNDIDKQRLRWWYAAPRNGHVSLYSGLSIGAIVRPLGLTLGSAGPDLHILFRELPPYAKHLVPALPAANDRK